MKYSLVLLTLLAINVFAASDEPQHSISDTATKHETIVNVNYPIVEEKQDVATQNVKDDLDVPKTQTTAAVEDEPLLEADQDIIISVVGQGVAPINTASPAQAYALAKRAAVADAYRLIAEKVKGVRVDGQDLIKNMMVKRSTIRTSVQAMVRNANIVETNFKEGLCEVEMEMTLSYAQFAQ